MRLDIDIAVNNAANFAPPSNTALSNSRVSCLTDHEHRDRNGAYAVEDNTLMKSEEFEPPNGVFLVGYVGDNPSLAVGGAPTTRPHRPCAELRQCDAENKRMYVADAARLRGYAPIVQERPLAELWVGTRWSAGGLVQPVELHMQRRRQRETRPPASRTPAPRPPPRSR